MGLKFEVATTMTTTCCTKETGISEWPLRGGDFSESMFTHLVRRHPDWQTQGQKRFALGIQPAGYFDTAREVLLFDHHEVMSIIVMPLKWNSWIVLHNKQYAGIFQVLQNFKANNDETVIRVCDVLWQEFLKQGKSIYQTTGPLHAFLVYLVVHRFPDIKSLPRWINVGRWYNWWLDHVMTASSGSSSTSSPSVSSPSVSLPSVASPEESKTADTSPTPMFFNPQPLQTFVNSSKESKATKDDGMIMEFLTGEDDASSSGLLLA
jgi:hypothetical protein